MSAPGPDHHHGHHHGHGHHGAPARSERHTDVVVVGGSAAGLAAAVEVARQGRSVIVVEADGTQEDLDAAREELRSHGGEVLPGRATTITREADGRLRVALDDDRAVVVRRVLAAGPGAARPGVEADGRPLDGVLVVDPSRVDAGRTAGTTTSAALAEEDVAAGTHPSATEVDWDHRYGGDQVWSGNPNGALVREVGDLRPGRALDVGAGEGGDAVWLAEHGWRVTANDVSRRALDRVAAEAARRGLTVEALHADVRTPDALPVAAFDLVTAHYASIPRTPDDRAVHALTRAVAPGGTLLIVAHDPAPMRTPDPERPHGLFDVDAYVSPDRFAALLAADPDWEVEVHGLRPRPVGAASASHHVDDLVLRARRGGSVAPDHPTPGTP